jgi:autotransporter strand-loop-strand O-heptosyltransferase
MKTISHIPKHSNFGKQNANICHYSFVDGASLEIKGDDKDTYLVQFIDTTTSEIIFQGEINNNQWLKTSRQYYTPWKINVFKREDNTLVFSHHYDCQGQRVYVALESKALGDTLAWLPVIETFRKKHGCEMICSTFINNLFKEQYPEIHFVEPSFAVHNLYAMYRIGWFYGDDGEIDYNKNVNNFQLQPLVQTCSDILGLEYCEQRPRIKNTELPKPLESDYVCIAVHSTAQAKYWNNPTGWNEVVQFLTELNLKVVLISREGKEYMGNKVPEGIIQLPPGSLDTVINYLQHAKIFIGIGSGLSWLSWAVGCKTCLISGFSYPYTEMDDVIRISPETSVCSGCFNRYRLNAGDWNWCPDHKDSPRMFECTSTINGKHVINAIEKLLI